MPSNLKSVLTKQQRIAELAQRLPELAFTSLAYHIDLQWLEEAYHQTRKDGDPGIDDVTGKEYAENLHENLQNLLDRLKSGTYKAPPVKRKHIPKGTKGETRPIGIPTFEDKIARERFPFVGVCSCFFFWKLSPFPFTHERNCHEQ